MLELQDFLEAYLLFTQPLEVPVVLFVAVPQEIHLLALLKGLLVYADQLGFES